VSEKHVKFGLALEALMAPGTQDVVADAFLEIRHPVGSPEAHGFTKSVAAVH
jgi:hypothetical protein